MTSEPKAAFLLRRAEEETLLALRTDQAPAAESHRELSSRYSAQARETLSAEGDGTASIRGSESDPPNQDQVHSELVSVLVAALRRC